MSSCLRPLSLSPFCPSFPLLLSIYSFPRHLFTLAAVALSHCLCPSCCVVSCCVADCCVAGRCVACSSQMLLRCMTLHRMTTCCSASSFWPRCPRVHDHQSPEEGGERVNPLPATLELNSDTSRATTFKLRPSGARKSRARPSRRATVGCLQPRSSAAMRALMVENLEA